jgi:hypothetical protein
MFIFMCVCVFGRKRDPIKKTKKKREKIMLILRIKGKKNVLSVSLIGFVS